MFPIFKCTEGLADEYFKKGYDFLQCIRQASINNKYVSIQQMENCMESFVQSYNTFGTIEAIANVLGFVLLIYAPAFDKEKQHIGEAICKENRISKGVIKNFWLRKEVEDDPIKEEFIENNSDFILECISVLKKYSKWSELGDYYLALSYLVGVVDNDQREDMNNLIGEEFMYMLVQLGNKYASAYWNKKYDFLSKKE